MANLLIFAAACSKKGGDEPVTPPTPDITSDTIPYLQLTTEIKVGEAITLEIDAKKEDQKDIWLDLNNNGKWDEGVDKKVVTFDFESYTLKAQTFRIYGKTTKLDCSGKDLTALDISHNPALTELYATNNKLASIGHLEHITQLGIDSHTMRASTLPPALTYLSVNETDEIATSQFKPLTNLEFLTIGNCKSISSIDLSQNTELKTLYAWNCNLTTLDLSRNTKLEDLYVSGNPLTNINIQGNTVLRDVEIGLTGEGKGLTDTALTNFIKALPSRQSGKEGKIRLSNTQKSEAIVNMLKAKWWKVK